MPVKRLIAAELAAGTLIGGTIAAAAPAANAYPGDPMPGCVTQFGSVLCDGPIRPDGTFQRCWSNPGSYTPGRYGGYIPPMVNCQIVDTNQPWPMIPFGAPQHHID
jgi:hypothetical protein